MFSTRQRCGHCHQLADMPLVFASRYKVKDPRPKRSGTFQFNTIENSSTVASYALAICPLCEEPSIVTYDSEQRIADNIRECIGKPETLLGGESMIKVTSIFPKPATPDDHALWPTSARSLFADASLMLREKKSPVLVIAACRAILETSIKELHGSGSNLKTKIDDLRQKGVITQPLADWAHRVRLDGNAAVHEIEGNETDAAELLDFVRMFLDMCFTLPKTIAAKSQASVPTPP